MIGHYTDGVPTDATNRTTKYTYDGADHVLSLTADSAGLAYLFTSYDAASGGSVVNQVQRTFNGLGQLTSEFQSHSGAVNTGSTLFVGYG